MYLMPRVNRIIQHASYDDYYVRNKRAEEERIFCRHGADHGLDVARIAYIFLLEGKIIESQNPIVSAPWEKGLSTSCRKGLPIDFGHNVLKEIVYAAGILHDIGRWVEYETGDDHALVSARLATPILWDCGFVEKEIETITQGILEHRLKPEKTGSLLGQALALADDWARDCKNCASQSECYKYTKAMEEIII